MSKNFETKSLNIIYYKLIAILNEVYILQSSVASVKIFMMIKI
jgi:hypothetical protein